MLKVSFSEALTECWAKYRKQLVEGNETEKPQRVNDSQQPQQLIEETPRPTNPVPGDEPAPKRRKTSAAADATPQNKCGKGPAGALIQRGLALKRMYAETTHIGELMVRACESGDDGLEPSDSTALKGALAKLSKELLSNDTTNIIVGEISTLHRTLGTPTFKQHVDKFDEEVRAPMATANLEMDVIREIMATGLRPDGRNLRSADSAERHGCN